MEVLLNKSKVFDFSQKILFFGLVFFYIGLYVLPDVSDTARIFYILVMLPMLYIIFFQDKYFFRDKYLWLLMLLPIYLALSHFWAIEENVTRSKFFHIKKVVYIFFFVCAVFFIVKVKVNFTRFLFQALFVAGFISALISIICFLSGQCGIVSGRLSSFSVQDINKAGAMYTVHMSICIFFMIHGFFYNKKNSFWVYLILSLGLIASGLAVILAKTHATWFMFIIILFFILIPKWSLKSVLLLFVVGILMLGGFIYFDGHLFLMEDGSFKIRLQLAQESFLSIEDHLLFGLGMTHKLPLLNLPHPHNIFIDVVRFGGIVGFAILSLPMLALIVKGMLMADKDVMIKLVLAWFIGSIAIMTVYAQQPITRPGGYIWFLYWMPITLLAAELSRFQNKGSAENNDA